MKVSFNLFCSFFTLFIFSISLNAQDFKNEILQSSRTYGETINKMEARFELIGKGKGSGYKQYLRWRSLADARYHENDPMSNYFQKTNIKSFKKATSEVSKNRSTHGSWENVGPFDYATSGASAQGGMGRIICAAFHPTNANIMWVGAAAGGLWKTTDGGNNWTPLTDGFASIGISDIAVDYTNPNIIYILTGDGRAQDAPSIGVLKTTDGGISWRHTDLKYEPQDGVVTGYSLTIHPTDPNVLFATINGDGIHRSHDGGETFLLVQMGTFHDIDFAPDDPMICYASGGSGFYRSVNAGLIWDKINDSDFPSIFSGMKISVSPVAPNIVYAICNGGTGVNGTYRGCFKSIDKGLTFSMVSNTPNVFGWALDGGDTGDQGTRDLGFVVSPTNEDVMFAGGACVWKSTNGGVSWSRESYWSRLDVQPYVHADMQNFYFNNNTFFICNDGGFYKSDDLAHSYTELSSGLAVGQFWELDVLGDEYMGGLMDNGSWVGQFDNPQYFQIGGGDGFGATWHSSNTSIQFYTTQSSVHRRQPGLPDYEIWQLPGAFDLWECEPEMYAATPGFLYVDQGNKLYRGNQVFTPSNWTWNNMNTALFLDDSKPIRGFAMAPSNQEAMYVLSDYQILKTENLSSGAPSWDPRTNASPGPSEMYQLEVDPNDENKLWVVCDNYIDGNKVFYSTDGAESWTPYSEGIENVPVRCLVHDRHPTNPGLYIGTEIGVYYRRLDMSAWVYFGNALPNCPVLDIEIDNGFVNVATHGRGVWRSPVYSGCTPVLLLTDQNDNTLNMHGTQHFHASDNILSLRSHAGNPGSEIYYTAGSHTTLTFGFEIKAGSFFEGKVGDCPN